MGNQTRRRFLRTASSGLLVGTAGIVGDGVTGRGRGATGSQPDTDSPYTSVYEAVIPSVAVVQVGPETDRRRDGLGSGFVVDERHLLTNSHVVGDARAAEVQFDDANWRTADVVGADPHSDLAVLAVADVPDGATPLPFAAERPTVGTEVVALGNPFGLDASVSSGIVSGVDRLLPSPSGFSIPAAIQTDAPVNPGNSGGPLVDLGGDVVGVVFAGTGQSIGFAISVALASRVVPELLASGEYEHPFLGVGFVPVSPLVAEANGFDRSGGVLVTQVIPDAPADGVLQPAGEWESVNGVPVPVGGDRIVELDGEPMPNQERLSSSLALETAPGDTVTLTVVRSGDLESLALELVARPDEALLPGDEPDDLPPPPEESARSDEPEPPKGTSRPEGVRRHLT